MGVRALAVSAPDVRVAASMLRAWFVEQALPLWTTRGLDRDAGLFEEQLTFDGAPVRGVAHRVMVQARQISVLALATHRGWLDARVTAASTGRAMIDRYWAVDGADGWVFSVTRDGRVADPTRDLYAHAFALFALAWLRRISPDPAFTIATDRTLAFLDRALADPRHGGYWDALPRGDALRRQNPHMHLLEAFLALYETTRDPAVLGRAGALVELARRAFIEPGRGVLRECFDDAWGVAPGPGLGSVEPGHLFEWAWLLRRYEALAGATLAEPDALVATALRTGVDRPTGRIVDETGEDGRVRRASSRCWPHAEAIRSLAVEVRGGSTALRADIVALVARLLEVYCPARLAGGWIDQVDADDKPVSATMPASTLYHLAFALVELDGEI